MRWSRHLEGTAFAGQRAVDALAGHEPGPVAIACCDGGPDVDLVAQHWDCPVASLERVLRHRKRWTNQDVGRAACPLRMLPGAHTARALSAYATSSELDDLGAAMTLEVQGPTARAKALLDDKVTARRLFMSIGLRTVDWVVCPAWDLSFDSLAARLGVPFVVQERVGAAGFGTWIVDAPEGLETVAEGDAGRSMLVSAWGGSRTLNVNALVGDDGVQVAPPSVQLSGIRELHCTGGEYCGNDWLVIEDGAPNARSAARMTQSVGQWLGLSGYRGWVGLDCAAEGEQVRPLEINPRMQGSTWLLQVSDGEGGPEGAQLFHHSPFATARPLGRPIPSGVYGLTSSEALELKRAGIAPNECGEDELLIGGAPDVGTTVDPGAVVARVFVRRSLTSADGRTLGPYGRRVAHAVDRLVLAAFDA